MRNMLKKNTDQKKRKLILALHSSTETLGIGLNDLLSEESEAEIKTFSLGRDLSNNLISCIQEIIPSSHWKQITRIGVSIGPGGYTSTRLTVVMARIISQQLNCSLDGVSSFALMAPRLASCLEKSQRDKPFWIKKFIPRRGILAGHYQLIDTGEDLSQMEVKELKSPKIISSIKNLYPSLEVKEDVKLDVSRLLNILLKRESINTISKWQKILPIYPTSPIENN